MHFVIHIHYTFIECLLSVNYCGPETERKFVNIPIPQEFNLTIPLFRGGGTKNANKVVLVV